MTKFEKSNFTYHGGYLKYDDRFVARFKYSGPFSKAVFLKQLLKNHTVEEYFQKLEIDHVAPLRILEQADTNWYNSQIDKFRARMLEKA
jgi:hypothetical protein